MKSKIVHAWNLKGYVKVDEFMRNLVRERFKNIYGSMRKAEIKMGLSDYHHRKLDKKYTKIDILFNKISKYAKINKSLMERHIVGWKDTINQESKGGRSDNIRFPIKLTPEYIRVIGHIIGDGHVARTSGYLCPMWGQKDTKNMQLLIKRLFNKDNLSNDPSRVSIPTLPLKVVCCATGINYLEFNRELFLKKVLELPKEHRVQVLTAIIEDEGTADKNQIVIRMSDENLMILIEKLIDGLGYDKIGLKKYMYFNGYHNKKMPIWRVSLNISGIQKYNNDLLKLEKKYGDLLGLWKKRKSLRELATHKSTLKGYKRNKDLRQKIINKRFKRLYFNKIKEEYNLTNNETMSILRYMKNKGDIIKIKCGEYKSNNEDT